MVFKKILGDIKMIESFKIDHTKLSRGVYISRVDIVENSVITTYDIRIKEPNKEPALSSAVSHTIEHIGATYLRDSDSANSVIYFGPMGCLTGFYLIMIGNRPALDLKPLLQQMFSHIANFCETIPGATEVECGNYQLHDLINAKQEAKIFLNEVLLDLNKENTTYPK